jgi:hypothetical protein
MSSDDYRGRKTGETQVRRTSISFDSLFEKMKRELMKEHRASSITDHLRGLVILDKLLSSNGTMEWDGPMTTFPLWTLAAFDLEIERGDRRSLKVKMKKKIV